MKFSAKGNTFFLTFYENTAHPLKDNLDNATTAGTSAEAFRRQRENTIAQEENKLSVDTPTLLLFQNSHQLLHTDSRNKAFQSCYSK